MKILAIESSCDELSLAILDDGKVLTNIISSQIKDHQKFGGVVPELAARLHLENIEWVIKSALKEADLSINEIELVAYTKNPGLIGSLIVGKIIAETIGAYLEVPIMGCHHILGHIYGASIEEDFVYPVLAMVVSGGHTQIQLLRSVDDYEIIGQTQDDAIGECYDKVARYLKLEYPGGPIIDKLAQTGNPDEFKLPIPKTENEFDFSYSGLKTACTNLINKYNQNNEEINKADFAASFQKTAVQTICEKFEKAVIKYQPKTITVAGGVSANSLIRQKVVEIGKNNKIEHIIIPKLEYCTDNGAMIGKFAQEKINISKKLI
ncbi:tRNA (adenosine(37)-N6)-threonylcarbamoyltransferase complex transferase subunit TsaD [Spiroplasma alleghenense]|uniref:tRNA N6-adenosine threonylcarbamoyltransferase n=1 Tax=Spiroplasma alleghenense TaxID=216931 RepID=A0A345Z2E3_9MOLU|nr:tRNA (adenosine(37)-N6)-threonylcarbamoyltransferase complex transferase subunit TsaD [Spiroplasma alleghenense]AXK50772.1 DNA-binding/iron metalloprotein/AP endonuclease [Spiroplasma alleghenense]